MQNDGGGGGGRRRLTQNISILNPLKKQHSGWQK